MKIYPLSINKHQIAFGYNLSKLRNLFSMILILAFFFIRGWIAKEIAGFKIQLAGEGTVPILDGQTI